MFLLLLVPFSTELFLKSKKGLSSKGGFLVWKTWRLGIKKARIKTRANSQQSTFKKRALF